jgi:Rieske Fe-S protein
MSCASCSRRSLLHGLALGTAGLVALGCGNDHGAPVVDAPADAPPDPVSMCGANLCVDHALAPQLGKVGGQLVAKAPTAIVIVVCTGPSTYVTVSDICTHLGCLVNFDASLQLLVCPCHGSEFELTGMVARGPAAKPLQVYENSLDAASQTLTITLS